MSIYQGIIPTRYTAPLLDYLRESGDVTLQSILQEQGLDIAWLHSSETVLTIEEFDRLLAILLKHTGRTDLGFEVGMRITLDTHGALGQAMAQCKNPSEVLRLASRFSKLMSSSFTLSFKLVSDHYELVWRPASGMSRLTLQCFYEIHTVSLYTLLQRLLGNRLPAYDSWIPMQRPAHGFRYKALSKLRVHFETSPLPEVRSVIPFELAHAPFFVQDSDPAPALHELYTLQQKFAKRGYWADWVRMMLREAESHQPSQAELAALMNISAHTLARHLRGEGFSFRDLANTIRHQRACQMIREGRFAFELIAQRLGYEHLSNFSHAFTKQEGMSPRAYRKQHLLG